MIFLPQPSSLSYGEGTFTMTAAFFSIPRARLSFFLQHSFCSRRLRHRRDSVLPSAAVISRWDHT